MCKKNALLGIGRSGTTILYYILQEMFWDVGKGNVDFVYEPFLWDRDVFNIKLNTVKYEFQDMASLSIEGIYTHLQLPLFVSNPDDYVENEYLRRLFETSNSKEYLLLKMIRANGRYKLLKAICPELKTVFVVRNPLDVVNSAIAMFSFFGEDFHKSDWRRFATEVNRIYNANLEVEGGGGGGGGGGGRRVEKYALYWYYMNRFAFDSFRNHTDQPLIICFENFLSEKECHIKRICDYFGIEFKKRYLDPISKRVGPSYAKANITKAEFDLLKNYLDLYEELLGKVNIQPSFNKKSLYDKYSGGFLESRKPDILFGKTPLYAKKVLAQTIAQVKA